MAKKYDPYAVIPSRATIQEKLDELREDIRRLEKLLKLATEIERERQPQAKQQGAAK